MKSNVVYVAKSVGGKAPPALTTTAAGARRDAAFSHLLVGFSLSYEGRARSSGRLYRPREGRKPSGMLSPPPQYGGRRYRLPVRDQKQFPNDFRMSDRASHRRDGSSFS